MRTTYGGDPDATPVAPAPRPLVIPLTNEQKGLACLERIETLLQTLVDNNFRPREETPGVRYNMGKKK